ncbi:MAG: hypothetical protein HQK49_10760 [Oligoflexia bacterium]|nr:hypothetical protein [Oligoflexia bacterium]
MSKKKNLLGGISALLKTNRGKNFKDTSFIWSNEDIASATTVAASSTTNFNDCTVFDNTIFDNLMVSLSDPLAFVIYIFLWRETIGRKKTTKEISYKEISKLVGIEENVVKEKVELLVIKNIIRATHTSDSEIITFELVNTL